MSKNKVVSGYTVKELSKKYDHSEVYIRRSINKFGTLKTTKVPTNDKGGYKHIITEEQYQDWRNSIGSNRTRDDGRNKFTGYLSPEEFELLMSLVSKEPKLSGIEIFRTNQKSEE